MTTHDVHIENFAGVATNTHILDQWADFLYQVEESPEMTETVPQSRYLVVSEFGNKPEKYDRTFMLGRQYQILPGYVGSTEPDVRTHKYWTAMSQVAPRSYKESHSAVRWDPNHYSHYITGKPFPYTAATTPSYGDVNMASIKAQSSTAFMLWRSISRRTDFDTSILHLVPNLRQIDFDAICSHENTDLGFVSKHINDFPWNFGILSQHPKLTWPFVLKHRDKKWSKVLLRNHPFTYYLRQLQLSWPEQVENDEVGEDGAEETKAT